MAFLGQYKESGHLIHKQKSCFVVSDKCASSRIQSVATNTGFSQKSLSIRYLGCNLFVRKMKIKYFGELLAKIEKKLSGGKSKLLSVGGRLILVKHALQSLPLHILAAFSPPKTIIRKVETLFAIFYGVHINGGFDIIW